MILPPEIRDLVTALRREIEVLRAENAALRQRVADLQRQLDNNSSNSSKPPSSDGLKKPPRVASGMRGKSGKTSGGQVGHAGGTLKQVAKPDVVERHEAQACRHCLAGLTAAMVKGVEKRQVFDLPEPRLDVTEHQAMIYRCACCRGLTTAAFPEGVASPAQYGPRVRAAAVYLNVQQLIPEDRVAQAMADLFGAATLCPDSVVAWGEGKAEEFEGCRGADRRARGASSRAPSRRNRLSRRRQGPMAPHRLDHGPDLVSSDGQTRRLAQGLSRRGRRSRPFQALLPAAQRPARAVQRPSLARTQGPGRYRQGAMGRANARFSRRRQHQRPRRRRRGGDGAADPRSAHADQTLQRHRPARARLPSKAAAAPQKDRGARTDAASTRTQSPDPVAQVQRRCPAIPL